MRQGYPTTQNTGAHWVSPAHSTRRMLMVGLIGGLSLVNPLVSTWAAVYQCVDKTGKTVLTNRQTGLRHCRLLVEDTVAGPKAGAGRKSQDSTEQTDVDMAPALADGLTPLPMPNDSGYLRMGSPDTRLPNPSSSSSPGPPCPPGLNPLNPLNDIPCSVQGESQPGSVVVPR